MDNNEMMPRGKYVRVDVESNFTGEWVTILMTDDREKANRIVKALDAEECHALVSCGCGSYPDGDCELCAAEVEGD